MFCWETPDSVIHEDVIHKIKLAKHCYTPTKTLTSTEHQKALIIDFAPITCFFSKTNSKSKTLNLWRKYGFLQTVHLA